MSYDSYDMTYIIWLTEFEDVFAKIFDDMWSIP